MRTAISRRRRSARASVRLATLAQAMMSTNIDIPSSQRAMRPLRTSLAWPLASSIARAATSDPTVARAVGSFFMLYFRSSSPRTRLKISVTSALTRWGATSGARRTSTHSQVAAPGSRQSGPRFSKPAALSEVQRSTRSRSMPVKPGGVTPITR